MYYQHSGSLIRLTDLRDLFVKRLNNLKFIFYSMLSRRISRRQMLGRKNGDVVCAARKSNLF